MSIQQLPNGRWRATVTDSAGKRLSAAKVLGLREPSFASKPEAREAEVDARRRLRSIATLDAPEITVAEWAERWTTDKLFTAHRKDSTLAHYRQHVDPFVAVFGGLKLSEVDSRIVSAWFKGGRNRRTLVGLSAMFTDAASPLGGELIVRNPFRQLGFGKGKGNANIEPPTLERVQALTTAAWRIAPPGFAAWLQVACWTGARPGELDALSWDCVDLDRRRVKIARQFNRVTGTFGTPKNGRERLVAIWPQGVAALVNVIDLSDRYCFVNGNGNHWTGDSRRFWWLKTCREVGYEGTIYLSTRHFFGHYLYETLDSKAEDVAAQLGHTDGGDLVRRLYGHHNADAAISRLEAAEASRDDEPPALSIAS